jgi:endonuclease YncB( thermonuclease family)
MFIFAMALSACGGGDGASFAPPTGNTHCGVSVGTLRITGNVTSVHDGDTITVGGESIRLASIDAPELDQAYGPSSRTHLAAMVLGQSVTVTYAQKDLYGRVVGTVFKPDCSQVNLTQVLAGAAWYYEAYQCEIDIRQRQAYAAAHASARTAKKGLWSTTAVAPWCTAMGWRPTYPLRAPMEMGLQINRDLTPFDAN